MAIKKELFGVLDGKGEVYRFVLENAGGMRASLLSLGAIIQELVVPARDGSSVDTVLGFDDAASYFADASAQGAVAGRVANRVSNARFTLDGKEYVLTKNHGKHQLHGGFEGFGKKIWQATAVDGEEPSVTFTHISPDGEEGYPATLTATVTYILKKNNALAIAYTATADGKTPVNLTNHAYFNLGGAGHVLGEELMIAAEKMLVTDAELIPTGDMRNIRGTAFDFTTAKPIGRDFYVDDAELRQKNGYDHCYVLSGNGEVALAASLYCKETGILMQVLTDQPALQLYTGNFLNCKELPFKGNVPETPQSGVCLEAQKMPDSVHQPSFPNTVIDKDEVYTQYTEYVFSVVK